RIVPPALDCKRLSVRIVVHMSADHRPVPDGAELPRREALPAVPARKPTAAPLREDTRLAVLVRGLVARGELDEARERFAERVPPQPRRAVRLASQSARGA